MKKFLVMIMLVFSLNGMADCSERYEKVVDKTTDAISFVLQCGAKKEVRKSVDNLGRKLGFCKKGPVCIIAGKVGAKLVESQIPYRWRCEPDIAMKGVEFAISKACSAATGL